MTTSPLWGEVVAEARFGAGEGAKADKPYKPLTLHAMRLAQAQDRGVKPLYLRERETYCGAFR